jgi:hypothetical protein
MHTELPVDFVPMRSDIKLPPEFAYEMPDFSIYKKVYKASSVAMCKGRRIKQVTVVACRENDIDFYTIREGRAEYGNGDTLVSGTAPFRVGQDTTVYGRWLLAHTMRKAGWAVDIVDSYAYAPIEILIGSLKEIR